MAKPWIEFVPDFISAPQASDLIAFINSQKLEPETGNCALAPTHDSIQWGPRQAYNSQACPEEFRIASSGPIPPELQGLHDSVEQRYQAAFNSIQVNRHWNEKSTVYAHYDRMHGDIVMLSVGAPRRFVLRYRNDDKAKTLTRWMAGDVHWDDILPSGSLLTIYGRRQFDLTHEMPRADHPSGVRISFIWRYITRSVVEGHGSGSKMMSDGMKEYKEAQAEWKAKHSATMTSMAEYAQRGQ